LLIDLAWNIDCGEITQWCHDNGVMYVNTSVEEWDRTSTPRTILRPPARCTTGIAACVTRGHVEEERPDDRR